MMTWMTIGICVEVAWLISGLTFLKLFTLKDFQGANLMEWLWLITHWAINVLLWPLSIIVQIIYIVANERQKE